MLNIYPYKEAGKHECSACGGGTWDCNKERYYNHAHHLTLKGIGGRSVDDSKCVALCPTCHLLFHSYKKDFIKKYGEEMYLELGGKLLQKQV